MSEETIAPTPAAAPAPVKPKSFSVKLIAEVTSPDTEGVMRDTLEMNNIDASELAFMMGAFEEFRGKMQKDAEGNPNLFFDG